MLKDSLAGDAGFICLFAWNFFESVIFSLF